MIRTALLIDADTLVYKAARRAEQVVQWDYSLHTLHAELEDGIREFDELVRVIQEGLDAELLVMALSDYDYPMWRLQVDPAYKAHRDTDGVRRPLLWKPLREYIHERHQDGWLTYQRPGLEGDDVLGILMTGKVIRAKRKICVSIDKDMKTIPGLHLNYEKLNQEDIPGSVFEVTEEEADRFHLIQTIAGDPTDGYPGCPGVGMVRAERYLAGGQVLEAVEHTFSKGARKGDTEIRWAPTRDGTPWEVVVSVYEANGLTEEDALRNARLARICRVTDYDFKTKEVKLWQPIQG